MAKTIKKTAAKPASPASKKAVKKAPIKKSAKKSPKTTSGATGAARAKKPFKKVVSEKDLLQKEANRIVNSAKKKQGRKPVKARTTKENAGLLDSIVDGMQEKKAKNITVLDLSTIENRVCDYFVICDADSKTHVEAIAGSVEEIVIKKTGEKPFHSEGYGNAEWILVDYINIVAHIFQRETREYYALEDLWADADIKHIN